MQCLFEELALVKAVANFLKNNTCDLKCKFMHFMDHKMADELLNSVNFLESAPGIIGDNCTLKVSECRHKVLCLLRQIWKNLN